MLLLLFLQRDTFAALDDVACPNARNTCELVLSDGQCTCACVCVYLETDECGAAPTELSLRLMTEFSIMMEFKQLAL